MGPDPTAWIDKIRRGEILPGTSIQTKVCKKVPLTRYSHTGVPKNSVSDDEVRDDIEE